MTRIRSIARHFYNNYLTKAREYRNAMNASFDRKDWNACVGNAVHCAINAVDALSVFKTEKRSAGERHEESTAVLISIDVRDRSLQEKAKQLLHLLGLKNRAEYGEQLISENEAITARTQAMRLLEYVETRIAKETREKQAE